MIKVESLTKSYGRCHVLKDISFNIAKGEIIGILGSNGAGKSTLMKLLSGYLTPNSGTITIDGMDIDTHSLEVRKRLGYLPENNPLYPEMRVSEYIAFRAALKGVPTRRIAEKVIDVLDLCGLRSVEKKLISTLSKGYRQRVGLADALVNEPALLLLDEPTIGLDSNQRRQICSLIKGLAHRHTVLLSTHLLSEAELLCDRLIILHHGKIVASGTPEEICQQHQKDTRIPTLEECFEALTRGEEN